MATKEQLERALINADRAGDIDAARQLARALKSGAYSDNTEPVQSQEQSPEGSRLERFNRRGGEILSSIPGVPLATEFASAVNRGITNTADFFTTKPFNGLMAATGMDARLPSISELPGIKQATQGGFMDEGLARDVTQKAGELVGPGALTGQAFRTSAALGPKIASGAQTVRGNVIGSMGSGTAGRDGLLSAVSGAGAEVGQEVGGDAGGMAGGLLAPTALLGAKAGFNQLKKSVGHMVPNGMPERLLESAFKFRPSIPQHQRANMTKTALREGITPNSKGLDKVASRLEELGSGLNIIIDDATRRGVTVPKNVVFKELTKLRKDLGGVQVDAPRNLRTIKSVEDAFNKHLTILGKERLTPRELQTLKTKAYEQINFDLAQGKGNYAKNETVKSIARQAKETLERIDPDIQGLNKQYGDLKELRPELERAISRLDNRNLIGLDAAVKTTAGIATGSPYGVLAGVGAAALGKPQVKAKTALNLYNLQQYANSANNINTLDPVLAKALMLEANRSTQSLPGLLYGWPDD